MQTPIFDSRIIQLLESFKLNYSLTKDVGNFRYIIKIPSFGIIKEISPITDVFELMYWFQKSKIIPVFQSTNGPSQLSIVPNGYVGPCLPWMVLTTQVMMHMGKAFAIKIIYMREGIVNGVYSLTIDDGNTRSSFVSYTLLGMDILVALTLLSNIEGLYIKCLHDEFQHEGYFIYKYDERRIGQENLYMIETMCDMRIENIDHVDNEVQYAEITHYFPPLLEAQRTWKKNGELILLNQKTLEKTTIDIDGYVPRQD